MGERKPHLRLRFWLGYLVVAAIALGSVAIALVVRDRESDNFERTQKNQAVRAAHQAEALAALSVGQLASTAAFYQAVEELTQHKFDVMADSLLSAGALSGTGLVLAVPGARRNEFERLHGYPIVERGTIGLPRADSRPQYFPLVFAASDSGLEPPLGYDLGADPRRAEYLLRARDRGEPAASRVMQLPIGGTGINVFHPIYRDGTAVDDVGQRRAAIYGFAVGAFHVPELAAAATAALDEGTEAQLLEEGRTVLGPQLPREDSAAAQLRIADRSWLLVVRDPDRPGVGLPVLIAVVGLALAALLGALVLVWSRSERMQELTRQAGHDPLTGLKNRRRFEEDMRTELARSRREKTVGAVLMLDLDNFKQVNDTLGHPMGDRVIAEIAGVLSARMRATDVVARLGGDEFAIVLPHCELDEAEDIAEDVTKAIRRHTSPDEAVPPITASIGIATFGPQSGDAEAVIAAADKALYEAKRGGRDTVRVSAGTVRAAS
ncbi:MAG TPA: diguanylate cyclase [Solirubrobacterales bacterium]